MSHNTVLTSIRDIQIEYHPYLFKEAADLVAFSTRCRDIRSRVRLLTRFCITVKEENIALQAYGPTSEITKFTGGPIDPVLAAVTSAVSERAGAKVEASQVLLKLASQLGAIVITTSSKEFRMKEQLAAGAIPALSAQEIADLAAAGGKQYKVDLVSQGSR